jgi:hypothetical protein
MSEILKLFYQILLFKKGPQDVPFSPALTLFTLSGYVSASFLLLFMSSHWLSALLQTAVEIVIMMIFTSITLFWVGKGERYQQTFCALLGTDALITLFAIPATVPLLIPSGDMAFFGFLLVVLLMLWHWAVIGHIFRHALDESFSFGLGIAFLYILAAYLIIGVLFPEASTSTNSAS